MGRIRAWVLGWSLVLVACAHPPPKEREASTAVPTATVPAKSSASATSVASAAEPEPPPPPPYDLAADLEERKTLLRNKLGKQTKFEVVEQVFLVAAPSGALGSSAVVTRKALAAYYNKRFEKRPARAVSVLLFETAPPYEAYCKARSGKACGTPFGFYGPDDRTIVMNVGPGIGTLTHELVHPIVEADFPNAPDWLNEGLASLYEAFALPKDGEIRGQKNFRHAGLVSALRTKSLRPHASLPALFAMSDKEFRGAREGLNYATARYFCQWLESQGKLWAFYQAWRDNRAKDPDGVLAFTAVMGKSPAALDGAWAAWVLAL